MYTYNTPRDVNDVLLNNNYISTSKTAWERASVFLGQENLQLQNYNESNYKH